MNRQLKKYLKSRAVRGPWQLAGASRNDYKSAIIIPVLAESESLPKTLASLTSNPAEPLQQTLLVIVINNRSDAKDEQKQDNWATLEWLKNNPYPQLNIAWVDAASPGLELPARQGVGLARKIGFDLALQQLDWSSQPLLISLDADTLVDDNYLPAIYQHYSDSCCGGATLPFRHQTVDDPAQETAIRHYELYLRSYLFGLQQAGSPYAYHCIGSALACRADAYLAVGGMNRRLAAEDFYFLQQLAKTTGVKMLSGTLVQPSARFSERVPFGTGKAVQGLVEENRESFQFSSAAAFSVLQQWLEIVSDSLTFPAEALLEKAAGLSLLLRQFLTELDFAENWRRLQLNHATGAQRIAAFHCWFDGLRTRQLLSRLDAERQQPVAELIAELLEWGGHPGVIQQTEQLWLLERLQSAGKF